MSANPLHTFRVPVHAFDGGFVLDGPAPDSNTIGVLTGSIDGFHLAGGDRDARMDAAIRHTDSWLRDKVGSDGAMKRRLDAAAKEYAHGAGRRLDSIRRADAAVTNGFHLARELEYKFQRQLETKFPEQDAFRLFPIETIPAGAKTHTFNRITRVGDAAFFDGGNEPIPTVNNTRTESVYDVATIATSFEYDVFTDMASGFAGTDYVGNGLRAANAVLNEFADRIVWSGNAARKFYGVLNTPGLARIVEPTLFDGSASVDDVLAALNRGAAFSDRTSNGVMGPTKVVMGRRVYRYLSTTRLDTLGQMTILKYWLENNPLDIRVQVAKSWHLDGSGPGGRSGILFYRDDGDAGIQNVVASGFTMLPVQQQVFTNRIYCYMRLGGIRMPDVGNQCLVWVTTAANA